jgi:hypothetical protein
MAKLSTLRAAQICKQFSLELMPRSTSKQRLRSTGTTDLFGRLLVGYAAFRERNGGHFTWRQTNARALIGATIPRDTAIFSGTIC